MPSVNADAEDAPSAASGVKVDHYNQIMKSAVKFFDRVKPSIPRERE